jgi:hypothetical protein
LQIESDLGCKNAKELAALPGGTYHSIQIFSRMVCRSLRRMRGILRVDRVRC